MSIAGSLESLTALGVDTLVVAAAAPGWLAWRSRSALLLVSIEILAPLVGLLLAGFGAVGVQQSGHLIATAALLLPAVVVLTMTGGNVAGAPRATAMIIGVTLTVAAAADQAAWGSALGHSHVNMAVAAGGIIAQACVASAVGLFVGVVTREGWSPSGSAVGVLALSVGLGCVLFGEHVPVAGS